MLNDFTIMSLIWLLIGLMRWVYNFRITEMFIYTFCGTSTNYVHLRNYFNAPAVPPIQISRSVRGSWYKLLPSSYFYLRGRSTRGKNLTLIMIYHQQARSTLLPLPGCGQPGCGIVCLLIYLLEIHYFIWRRFTPIIWS